MSGCVVAVDLETTVPMFLDLDAPVSQWVLIPTSNTPGWGGRVFPAGERLLAQELHDAGEGSTLALMDFRPTPPGRIDAQMHPMCLQLLKLLRYTSVSAAVFGVSRQNMEDRVRLTVLFQCSYGGGGAAAAGQAVLGQTVLEFSRSRADVVVCGLPLMFDDENMRLHARSRMVLRSEVAVREVWDTGKGGLWFHGAGWGAQLDLHRSAYFLRFRSRGFVHQPDSLPLVLRCSDIGLPSLLYEILPGTTTLRLLAHMADDGVTTRGLLEMAFVVGRRLLMMVANDPDGAARFVVADL